MATPTACGQNSQTHCLSIGRFQVRTAWQTPDGTSGTGTAVRLTPDTGYFWFFSDTNIEMVIKVLNACSFANRIWVSAGGLTSVQVTTTVTDTNNGAVKTYTNPLGTPFQPLQDNRAFCRRGFTDNDTSSRIGLIGRTDWRFGSLPGHLRRIPSG